MGVYAKKKTSKGQKRWTVAIYFKGRRRDFTVKGSKADAEAFEARQRVELAEQGVDAMRVVPRLSDFCVAHYRPHAETRLRNTTWYKQKFLVAEIMAWLGNLKLDECGTVETGERYARIRRDCGLKPVSVVGAHEEPRKSELAGQERFFRRRVSVASLDCSASRLR
jgi:hypothetical protein